jgi:hypothetical protein
MNVKFYELAIGAGFFCEDRRYEKLAMSIARGEDGLGHIFSAGPEFDGEEGGPALDRQAGRFQREIPHCFGGVNSL